MQIAVLQSNAVTVIVKILGIACILFCCYIEAIHGRCESYPFILMFCSPSPPATLVFMFLSKLETLLQTGELKKRYLRAKDIRIFYGYLRVNILVINHI